MRETAAVVEPAPSTTTAGVDVLAANSSCLVLFEWNPERSWTPCRYSHLVNGVGAIYDIESRVWVRGLNHHHETQNKLT